MRDNTSRKKIAAVVVAILVILYMGPLVGVTLGVHELQGVDGINI